MGLEEQKIRGFVVLLKRLKTETELKKSDDDIYINEGWSSLKRLCDKKKDWSYHTTRKKKFPFDYKGWHVTKLPVFM